MEKYRRLLLFLSFSFEKVTYQEAGYRGEVYPASVFRHYRTNQTQKHRRHRYGKQENANNHLLIFIHIICPPSLSPRRRRGGCLD